jgi:hypothetical protein
VIHLRHQSLQLGEVFVVHRGDRRPDACRLESHPHGVNALDVGDRELGDPDAAIRLRNDKALTLKQAEGLPQRGSADAELARQRDLRCRLARRDLAAQDRASKTVVDNGDILSVACGFAAQVDITTSR